MSSKKTNKKAPTDGFDTTTIDDRLLLVPIPPLLRIFKNLQFPLNPVGDSHYVCDMALKLSHYFYLLIEKPLGHYFQVWSTYYQAAHCNQKTPIPISSR